MKTHQESDATQTIKFEMDIVRWNDKGGMCEIDQKMSESLFFLGAQHECV